MKFLRAIWPAILILAWAAGSAFAMSPPVFSDRDGAIRGHDPVAYFTEGTPLEGSPEFTHEWMGAEWRFVSAEHRDLFAEDPEAYAPQYGGYCAWAASQGYVASIDPEAWEIYDGKLYLNYSRRLHRRWTRDKPGNIAKADANWPGILE
ncbi:MAG: YHS domain protein [Rhodobacteraceae bacterium]|nr:YHS domain protein [Paracoccaceae bacterium]